MEDNIFKTEEINKKFTEKEKKARTKELHDIKTILKLPEGRRFLWRLLSKCGVFRSSFTPNSNQTAFNEGDRNRGLAILRDIVEADSSAYNKMQNEYMSALNSKQEDKDG